MPLFNPDKIASLVSEMRKAINRLKSLGTLDKESFLNDPDKIGSAKYNFVVAVESSIDKRVFDFVSSPISLIHEKEVVIPQGGHFKE